jgi:hypothetical protein
VRLVLGSDDDREGLLEPAQQCQGMREAVLMVELGDVVAAADALLPLQEWADDDHAWLLVAAPTLWTVARTVEHVADALVFYAGQVARRADRRLPVLRDGRAAPPSEQLTTC